MLSLDKGFQIVRFVTMHGAKACVRIRIVFVHTFRTCERTISIRAGQTSYKVATFSGGFVRINLLVNPRSMINSSLSKEFVAGNWKIGRFCWNLSRWLVEPN